MTFKAVLLFAAQALLAQVAFSQCNCNNLSGNIGILPVSNNIGSCGSNIISSNLGIPLNSGINFNSGIVGNGLNYGYSNGAPTSGGNFVVLSGSPISPSGLAAYSENGIEGALIVNGNLPFASAVTLEGNVASGGQAGVNYGCGNSVALNSAGNGVGLGGIGAGIGGINAGIGGINAGIGGIGGISPGYALGGLNGLNIGIPNGCGCL